MKLNLRDLENYSLKSKGVELFFLAKNQHKQIEFPKTKEYFANSFFVKISAKRHTIRFWDKL